MKGRFIVSLMVTGIFVIGCPGGKHKVAETAKIHYNQGATHLKQGDYDQAIRDFDEAINIDPGLALAFNNRGMAYVAKGNYDQAIRDFAKAIEIDPGLAEAYNNRGNALTDRYIFSEKLGYDAGIWSKRDYDQAIKDFTKACELGIKEACERKLLPNVQSRKDQR